MKLEAAIGAAAAPLFVVLWSTGFIGAKLGLPHAEPLTFLSLRFAAVAALLVGFVVVSRAVWPPRRHWRRIALIGVLVHGVYLGGVFVAISLGLDAGLSALIAALGPIFTALISRSRFGERLGRLQWLGMALGFAGVALVVGPKLGDGFAAPAASGLVVLAALAFAYGAVEQRALGPTPMAAGNAIQYAAAFIVCGVGALLLEDRTVSWTGEFAFALAWLVGVLSIGAVSLYYILLRRGAASTAASLLFLVPASTALIAWPLFGETLGANEIAGFAVAMIGVALVTRTRPTAAAAD